MTDAPPPMDLGPTTPTGDLRIGKRKDTAAGVAAVLSSAKVMVTRAGAARTLPLLGRLNQHDGFDCPSCAWPDPRGERSFAEFCENGAKAVADAATRDVVDRDFFAEHDVHDLASRSDRWLNDRGRIGEPLVRMAGSARFHPIAWDDAFALVGDTLRGLDDPDRALFYTSGRASNEAAFLYQLFVRAYGTNNLPDCSNMCHESSGVALSSTVGAGKGTVQLDDFDRADLVVVMGQNPGTNHPRMLTALQRAKERGAVIVSINPLPETGLSRVRNPQDFADPRRWPEAVTGVDLADDWLPVRVGGDLALLTGVQKALFARDADGRGGIDHAFVAGRTTGVDDVRDRVADADWAELEQASGIDRAAMEALAARLATTDRIIWCWAMGLTQHEHAVGTLQQIVNLTLLRGSLGKPGAGLCPVRGHSNVQGDRTVGIWDKPQEDFLAALDAAVGITAPREHGLDVVDGIRAMRAGEIDVFVSLGGNWLSAAPDTAATADGLQRLRLNVQIATKLNRSHLTTQGTTLLLPCLARTDRDVQASGPQFVSCENSMGVVMDSQGTMTPVSEDLRSEPVIVAGMAAATLGATTPVDWAGLVADYDRIRDLIETVVPGFDDYNRRVRQDDGFVLPNVASELDFSSLPDGRAVFTAYDVPTRDLADDELAMMTVRSHDQFNTTIYADDDRYRGVRGERRVVFLHPDDAASRGLAAGDVVDLVGRPDNDGHVRRAPNFVVVPFEIPRGDCATYFPEANVLVPLDSVAKRSNTPTSKLVPVTLERR